MPLPDALQAALGELFFQEGWMAVMCYVTLFVLLDILLRIFIYYRQHSRSHGTRFEWCKILGNKWLPNKIAWNSWKMH